MRTRLWSVVVAAGLSVTAASGAAAQGVELGVDLGLGYGFDSEVFDISAPTAFRVGFPVGEAMTIEPRTTLSFASGNGATLMTLAVQGAIMYPFAGDRREGAYVAALPTIALLKFEEDFLGIDETATQFSLGGGVGVRIPQGERLGLRLEAQLVHNFDAEATELRGLFGVSFWTR